MKIQRGTHRIALRAVPCNYLQRAPARAAIHGAFLANVSVMGEVRVWWEVIWFATVSSAVPTFGKGIERRVVPCQDNGRDADARIPCLAGGEHFHRSARQSWGWRWCGWGGRKLALSQDAFDLRIPGAIISAPRPLLVLSVVVFQAFTVVASPQRLGASRISLMQRDGRPLVGEIAPHKDGRVAISNGQVVTRGFMRAGGRQQGQGCCCQHLVQKLIEEVFLVLCSCSILFLCKLLITTAIDPTKSRCWNQLDSRMHC